MNVRNAVTKATEFATGRRESLFAEDIAQHEQELTGHINGASALVIGGGGTIGSAFVRELLKYKPAKLVVMDTNENALTELTRYLRSTHGQFVPPDFRTYPMDYGSEVASNFLKTKPSFDIVANFAAHKHVRSEKDVFSVQAMFNNNVFKAWDLLEQLAEKPPRHFFCVSTDKASSPVNLMGASKQLMEHALTAFSSRMPVATARFANVAFSNGSLLDGFLRRIELGQPLSAPRDIQRYFVSSEESGQICLLACMLGRNGEVLFPRLSQENDLASFADIATVLLEGLGLSMRVCESEDEAREYALRGSFNEKGYPVYLFESDTTGEKSVEEFYGENEQVLFDRFDSLGVVIPADREFDPVAETISKLRSVLNDPTVSKEEVVQRVSAVLPDFRHLETRKNLDSRM